MDTGVHALERLHKDVFLALHEEGFDETGIDIATLCRDKHVGWVGKGGVRHLSGFVPQFPAFLSERLREMEAFFRDFAVCARVVEGLL